MKRYVKFIPYIIAVLLAVIIIQCAVNPVTGKKEIMLVSESMEIGMGEEIDRGLRMEYGMYDDPGLRDYITRIGEYMAPNTHRPKLKYHFAVLDTPVENAFAAPGGYIYITRGLLALMNSEAEMASVIGHELGHVNARHSARQITRSILFSVGIALAAELSKDFRKIAPVAAIATELLFLKYSRSDEYQADQLGFDYSIKTGYNSGEMITFFSTLNRMTISEGGVKLPNFLSTHPMTPKRIDKIKEYLQAEEVAHPGNLARLKVNRNDYFKMMDGLIYGDNPRQGYVEGNAFYHPDMRFMFRAPYGWKINNTPRQVTMASNDGKAVILLQVDESDEPLEIYSQKLAKNLTQPKVLGQGYKSINGMNAYHSIFQLFSGQETQEEGKTKNPAASQEQKTDVNITCIRKEGRVYSFFSVTADQDWRTYSGAIYDTINSFKPLNNAKYIDRQPHRVHVKQVSRAQTLLDYLSGLGIPRENWDKIALINSMQLDQQLSPNQLVKVIQ